MRLRLIPLAAALVAAILLSPPARADWTTYAGSPARAGIAPGAPANPQLHRRWARTVDGEVYAQPLIADGRIYVATENNSVYAFSADGRRLWRRRLGEPVPGGDLPCGNISPSGITGTPVISHGKLYVVAFLRPRHRHVLFGLRLGSGRIALRGNVDPPNSIVEQQRGALLAAGGRIYVPYGGLYGDCGPFRGIVASVTESGRRRLTYRNPASQAGIWAPAGISYQSGTLLASTGNGGSEGFGYQNSVVRLSQRLARLGYWAPRDWRSLSQSDTDVSAVAPLPVTGDRVLQAGKDGVVYLLRQSLGGIGGELQSSQACRGGAFGAMAFRAPLAILSCGGALQALRVEGGRLRVAWHGADGMVPVIAGGSIFTLARGGALNQVRFADGRLQASVGIRGGATSFPALAVSGRMLVAPAGSGVVAFSL